MKHFQHLNRESSALRINNRVRNAFTLIELLVVIAIIAILAVVVVLTLNPAQLLAQSRDSSRVSDMATLNSALSLYQIDRGGIGNMGASSIVYTSLSDISSTCGNLNLPILPSSYTYNCTNSTSTRLTNATGWIPVNFQNISSGAPFGSLPIDPANTSSSRLYYTYNTNGSLYETTASMESSKYKLGGSNDVISSDGGTLASVYEKGTGSGLEPLDYGDNSLVGYWPLNEGSGNIAYDASGNNATGTWSGTKTGTNSTYYSAGKVGSYAGTFDGSTNYVGTGANSLPLGSSPRSMFAWVYPTGSTSNIYTIYAYGGNGSSTTASVFRIEYPAGNLWWSAGGDDINSGFIVTPNTWHFVGYTYTGGTILTLYYDGKSQAQSMAQMNTILTGSDPSAIGTYSNGPKYYFQGLIDDVRIYNRALSAAEIQAMYNAGK